MATSCVKLSRRICVIGVPAGSRGFAAGGAKAKKGSKGAGDAPKASTISNEVKASTVVGPTFSKTGSTPSELQRRKPETLSYDELQRLTKLDNRARIKENNAVRAKN
ncbi:unnamed protein product [Spirodela intermedia]|uniref:Large ribosomal subunit protein mL54 n=1 Tax=Spirodela intermedia TaxID=51605 RepID=A0A7I8IRR2_SPIIN|nr:unnamed protein product [Spirodela intermedia]CAA6659661.1 unnamed protein product [Spirodela intermedia]